MELNELLIFVLAVFILFFLIIKMGTILSRWVRFFLQDHVYNSKWFLNRQLNRFYKKRPDANFWKV